MLDRARPTPPRPHDLHRSRPRGGLHGPDVGYQRSLRPHFSVQITADPHAKPQVSGSPSTPHPKSEPSQVKVNPLVSGTDRRHWYPTPLNEKWLFVIESASTSCVACGGRVQGPESSPTEGPPQLTDTTTSLGVPLTTDARSFTKSHLIPADACSWLARPALP